MSTMPIRSRSQRDREMRMTVFSWGNMTCGAQVVGLTAHLHPSAAYQRKTAAINEKEHLMEAVCQVQFAAPLLEKRRTIPNAAFGHAEMGNQSGAWRRGTTMSADMTIFTLMCET